MRRKSNTVYVGNIAIGGDAPISIQSMTNTDSNDFVKTTNQALKLQESGCDIVRITVPNEEAAGVFTYAKNNGVNVPLVADIHFDYKLAIAAAKNGADKIRINPGNIGEEWKVKEVVDYCKYYNLPIRIGVNSGSLDKRLLEKYGSPTLEAIFESAMNQAEMLEKFGFSNIVISLKSSNVMNTINAYTYAASRCSYPLHVGITEAGDDYSGLVKGSIGIGSLLASGIGDTIRVSLTADPIEEVKAAKEILKSLDLYSKGYINVVSCPTCGRTKIDLIALSKELKSRVEIIDTKGKNLTVALMGCVVNGPGEAREADVGVAGGEKEALLFKKGEIVRKIPEDKIVETLINEIKNMII